MAMHFILICCPCRSLTSMIPSSLGPGAATNRRQLLPSLPHSPLRPSASLATPLHIPPNPALYSPIAGFPTSLLNVLPPSPSCGSTTSILLVTSIVLLSSHFADSVRITEHR